MPTNCILHLTEFNSSENFHGRVNLTASDGVVSATVAGNEDSYILGYKLDNPLNADGLNIQMKLVGWEEVKYAAVGYLSDGKFNHIKSLNIRLNEWVDFGFCHQDLIWNLQNPDSRNDSALFEELRIFVKGTPSESAYIKVSDISVFEWVDQTQEAYSDRNNPVKNDVLDSVYGHLKRSFRDYQVNVEHFLATGECPMPGGKFLSWSANKRYPNELSSVNTYRYAWHAQHPAINCLLYAYEFNDDRALYLAKSLVESWLEHSYFSQEEDQKYCWYDHGTAERLISFLLLWQTGLDNRFEARFMHRLSLAIEAHARLLSSEAFYAFNQNLRYHNHAWFQDAGLLTASLLFSHDSAAEEWKKVAISRFSDQLDNLIVRDGGFAIFVENSIGYHHGVQNLARFFGEMVVYTGEETEIPQIAKELIDWSDFLRYPDGRVPAQGDTFRLPPRTGKDVRRGRPWKDPGCTVLPKAGYAVIKGNHENQPWMLCLFNTSLSNTHKHQDNLSITFWFDGVEWLIDPSFYSHDYDGAIETDLRSEEGHNGLVVSGVNKKQPVKSHISSAIKQSEQLIEARTEYDHGVKFSRSLRFIIDNPMIEILDVVRFIKNETNIKSKLNLILSENVIVRNEHDSVILSSEDSEHTITISNCSFNEVVDMKVADSVAAQGFREFSSVKRIQFDIASNYFKWSLKIT